MTTNTTKTNRAGKMFELKSSAARAAKQDGFTKDQIAVLQNPDSKLWSYAVITEVPENIPTEPVLSNETPVEYDERTNKDENDDTENSPAEMTGSTDLMDDPDLLSDLADGLGVESDEVCPGQDASKGAEVIPFPKAEAAPKVTSEQLNAQAQANDQQKTDAHLPLLGEQPVLTTKSGEVKKTTRVYPTTFVKKSEIESPTKLVWRIADEMTGTSVTPARRRDVVLAALKMGVATNTAKTQYQWWKQAREESIANAAKANAKK